MTSMGTFLAGIATRVIDGERAISADERATLERPLTRDAMWIFEKRHEPLEDYADLQDHAQLLEEVRRCCLAAIDAPQRVH